MPTIDGRVRHYGSFYGLTEAGTDVPRTPATGSGTSHDPAAHPAIPSDAPLVLVHGNCQAEAVRVLLDSSVDPSYRTVRIPPVFEMTADDVPHLRRLAARASVLVSQPIRDDYRDLPVGTGQVAAMMPRDGTVIRWPVLRFAGFHPWQVIIRDPLDPGRDPPVVPYHDLRTVAAAAGRDPSATPSIDVLTTIRELSTAELARRELRDCDVAISDLFETPQYGDMLTINHPGNRVLLELARRIQTALGNAADAVDPGRTLLREVVAPVEQLTLDALGIGAAPQTDWRVGGRVIRDETVRETQLAWYRANPHVATAGYERHDALMDLLGLG